MGNLGCTAAFSRVQPQDNFTTELQNRTGHYNSLMETMIFLLATKYNEAEKGRRWRLTNTRSSLNTLMCLNPGLLFTLIQAHQDGVSQIGKNPSGGRWKAEEQAILTEVQVYYKHVKVMCDNISTTFCINIKGVGLVYIKKYLVISCTHS